MKNRRNALLAFFFFAATFVISPISSYSYDLERNKLYTHNKFLQLKPNGQSISELEDEIKPSIDLKGGSVQEEKELLTAFYVLGYTTFKIVNNYESYPLGLKLGDSTIKATLISSLKNLRDLMAQVEAEEKLLELITEITNTIENEDINSKKANPKTLALLNEMSVRIYEHIKNTFGTSYGLYYSFGTWTNKVMTYSELMIIINGLGEQEISKTEKENLMTALTEEFKQILELATTFKTQTEDLTVKAVSRNLDSIQETASEIKSSVDESTAKRLYDYSLNIYFGIVPQN